MKALIYNGVGQKEWVDKPIPTIEAPTDVIVKVTATTICGTDLHILKGDVPTVAPGITLGHEGVEISKKLVPASKGLSPVTAFSSPASRPAGRAGIAARGCIRIA